MRDEVERQKGEGKKTLERIAGYRLRKERVSGTWPEALFEGQETVKKRVVCRGGEENRERETEWGGGMRE